jgi:F-type H+-transporting ATPase subunit gamma
MPLQTKAIKQKIKSVGNIKKITKTMEMVSISKMRRAVDKALATRAYSHYALELLVNISKDKNVSNPLMVAGKSNKELIVVIASNKGLCGGYHSNLLRALSLYLSTSDGNREFKAVIVGKYSERICKKLNLPIFASFMTFSEYSNIEQTKELSELISREFIEGDYASVKILYTEFLKSTTYKPVLRELFPINVGTVKNIIDRDISTKIDKDNEENSLVDYKFEPNLNIILESILPGLIDIVVYQTLAEAFASEHSSRMFAMKNAGDSATTILNSLLLSYNHARQDGITRELSEIVAGAEALNS